VIDPDPGEVEHAPFPAPPPEQAPQNEVAGEGAAVEARPPADWENAEGWSATIEITAERTSSSARIPNTVPRSSGRRPRQ